MPNWCQNSLTIEGPGADKFLDACKGKRAAYQEYVYDQATGKHMPTMTYEKVEEQEFTFNALVPVPQHILDRGYGYSDTGSAGYNWQNSNWGTKWDPGNDVNVHLCEPDRVELSFDTAWSPPGAWVEKVSLMYPDLTFTLAYVEEGCAFVGKDIYKDGLQEEEFADYSNDKDAYRSMVEDLFGYDPLYDEGEDEERYDPDTITVFVKEEN